MGNNFKAEKHSFCFLDENENSDPQHIIIFNNNNNNIIIIIIISNNNVNTDLKENVIIDNPNSGRPIEGDALDGDGCVDLVNGAHLGGVPAREIPTQNALKVIKKA